MFELLMVVGILLALLAIAMPVTLRTLEARELESTEESIASELIKARVKAQESGRPVEVLVFDAPSRVVSRYFATGSGDAGDTRSQVSRPRERSEVVDPVRDSWWEESALHPSVSLATPAAAAAAEKSADSERGQATPGGVRLAIYLPDGTTLFATSLFLLHQSGLRSSVSVDPFTGQPAIRRETRGEGRTLERDSTGADDANDRADERRTPMGEGADDDDLDAYEPSPFGSDGR
jgi:type II secretory pathway pseudopilin PulG